MKNIPVVTIYMVESDDGDTSYIAKFQTEHMADSIVPEVSKLRGSGEDPLTAMLELGEYLDVFLTSIGESTIPFDAVKKCHNDEIEKMSQNA